MIYEIQVFGMGATNKEASVEIHRKNDPKEFVPAKGLYDAPSDCWFFLFDAEEGDIISVAITGSSGVIPPDVVYLFFRAGQSDEFRTMKGDNWAIQIDPQSAIVGSFDTEDVPAFVHFVKRILQEPPPYGTVNSAATTQELIDEFLEDPSFLASVVAGKLIEDKRESYFAV